MEQEPVSAVSSELTASESIILLLGLLLFLLLILFLELWRGNVGTDCVFQVRIIFLLVPIALINQIVLCVFFLDLFFNLLPVRGVHVRRVDATRRHISANLIDLKPKEGNESEHSSSL
jgi:hypothetical protein